VSPRRAIVVLVAVSAAGFVGWRAVERLYVVPRAALADDIALYRNDIRAKQRHIDKLEQVRRRLAEIASTTLGAEPDALEHRLRTELVALAEASGLSGVEVKGARPVPRGNPVVNARVRERQPLRAQLRQRPDFHVVRATLEGRGRLEDVATALATLQSQPWVARVESFNIKPESDRRAFSLRVDLTTLFVPDLMEHGTPAARLAELSGEELARAQRLGSLNVFRRPDPPPPVIAQKEDPPPAPPAPAPKEVAPPYGDWRLAGVMRGSHGPAAILVNSRTRETRTLAPGEDVLGFVFVEGEGEQAEFNREGERFVIRNGQTLEQRGQVE
jgi:hypothetical protein